MFRVKDKIKGNSLLGLRLRVGVKLRVDIRIPENCMAYRVWPW